jgi:hypothetical protein
MMKIFRWGAAAVCLMGTIVGFTVMMFLGVALG